MKFRKANREDLEDIVALLAADVLGSTREQFVLPLPESYIKAFENIDKDVNQELIVVENTDQEIIGTLQLSFIPYLTYQGGIRAQIEAVRIRASDRGKGYGTLFFSWAIARARERKAHLIQLTTDKNRPEALDFYKKLGFVNSHEGLKLHL